jgi:hypothetical protein
MNSALAAASTLARLRSCVCALLSLATVLLAELPFPGAQDTVAIQMM